MRAFFAWRRGQKIPMGGAREWSADALAKITWRKELLGNLLAG